MIAVIRARQACPGYHAYTVNIRFTHLLALVALAAMAPGLAFSAPATSTDRVIVKWRDAGSATRIGEDKVSALAERRGRRLAAGRVIGGGMSVVRLDRERTGAELDALMADLRSDPAVELVVADRRVKALAYTPNDPLFTTGQWYLKSAQPSAIRADAAWDVTKGGGTPATSPVVVAVLDTGVRFNHPDLAGKLVPGYDFVNLPAAAGDGDGWDADASDEGDFISAAELASGPFSGHNCGGGPDQDQPTDSSWHGTRVAGMIAANTDNGAGVAGTGFNIRVQPIRVLSKCGGFNSDVLAGMYWASGLSPPPGLLAGGVVPPLNATPAQILNMSLGSADACDAMYATAVEDITKHGVLIVASAGNDGKDVGSPANCPGVMAVAGVRHVGTKVGFSDLGPAVALSAPGGNCVNIAPGSPCLFSLDTTSNAGLTTPGANNYTDQLNPNVGTSFASPLAAGVAGLMKAVNPSLSPAALIARMKASARPFPTTSDTVPAPPACHLPTGATDVQNTECICNTQVCGAGLLFASGAVNEALRPIAVAAVTGTLRAGNTVSLDGSASGVATGRTGTYQWSVVSATSGASPPAITNAAQSVASVPVQANGTVLLRLTVTDNLGATDSADVSIVMAAASSGGTTTTSPPPSTSTGGGGAYSWLLLLLSGGLLIARRRRNFAH
ncbi:MAG: S8 family peptidase [Proteobacteria bacterium]|nr:S8 family peptidase [Pseudomonadota bacterium]